MSKFIACITVAMEMICVPGEILSFPVACLRGSSHLLHLLLVKFDMPCLTICCNMYRFVVGEKSDTSHRRKEPSLTSSKFIQFIFKSV